MAKLLGQSHDGIAFNAHYTGDSAIIYRHACALGCECIVSKRLGSPYQPGRSTHWIKVKNPAAPAVKREAEEMELASHPAVSGRLDLPMTGYEAGPGLPDRPRRTATLSPTLF